ncbi:hypothetical protein TIFTF001_003949 [Ficus carica]|uniref:Uncharacterized protein n=1 Tax=Ficus carica TaxID=3494 RepID=A0AA87Z9Y5_FICCA|nr:hypothetical protein TIFTF001_003949 [Ficus carica]
MCTFILLYELRSLSSSYFHDIVSNFKLLRALSLKSESTRWTLPNSLGKLKHLSRYTKSNQFKAPLRLKVVGSWTRIPRGIGELTSLRTLDCFIMPDDQSSESAGFGELNNLCGGLHISIKRRGELGVAAAQYLKDKKHLESLCFSWYYAEEETMENAKEAF